MIPGASIVAVASVLTVAALVAGKSRFALAIGAGALVIPFFVPDLPGPHFVAALGAAWGTARIGDLVRDREPRPALMRVWQAFAGFDTRTTELGAPTFAWRLLASGILFVALTAFGIWVCLSSTSSLLRWGGGVVFAYCSADALDRLVRFGYGLGGLRVPRIQNVPVAARSLAEFWASRWNGIVSAWLRREIFMPVARRFGGAAGLVAAFVVSAVLHAFITAPAVGLAMAAMMASFFLAQCALVFVERLLRVPRWPAAAAHAWVVSMLLLTSPLFVGPMMRVVVGR